MKLYAHQKRVIDSGKKRLMLVHDVGTGKTLTLLSLADKHADKVLIVCPKGMREQWASKIKEYGIVMHAYIVTKEELRRDHKKLPACDAVIIDEVHHFSGHKSQMHKALMAYLIRVQPTYVWSGTATPYRREPFNVWALSKIHGHCQYTWIKFREEFYQPRYMGRNMIWEPKTDSETREKLYSILAQFSDFARLDDCFDMPEQIDEEPEEVEQSKEQREWINQLRVEEQGALVVVNKTHQVENGSLKGNEFVEDVQIGCAKDDRVLELAEAHSKLLVFCRYNLQIERLRDKLHAAGKRVVTITGENSDKHYDLSVAAERSPECVVVAQIGVAAGYELPSFSVVVFASLSYSYLDWVQARGRVIRGNKLGRHVFMYLIGGEVDRAVYECIREKKDFDPARFDI